MKIYLFTILIALTLFSCKKESSIDSHCLVKADSTLNIHVGTKVNPATNNMTYLEIDNKKLIAYANMNDLMFYDIKEKNIFHKIRFQQDGSNGIGDLKRFHVENLDSIYIFSYTHLILSDSSGHVYKRKDFSNLISFENTPIAPMPSFYGRRNNKVIYSQNKLNIACYLMTDNNPDIEKTPTGIIYDIQEDSLYLNNRCFPSIDKSYPAYFYSRDKGGSKYVYSFRLNNNLIKISEDGQYEVFSCKSKFAPKRLTAHDPEDLKKDVIASIKEPEYYSLVYDKWNKLYYRFFYPGNDKIEKDKNLNYYWALKDNPEQFSVMILNDDLKVIGETLIPENTCNPFMYFINEDGLHFALHVNNPDFDPDYLKFARFTVEESNNENK